MTSAAGSISAQWNGAETASSIARLRRAPWRSAMARSTAALWPDTTTWPGALSLATSQTSSAVARRRRDLLRRLEIDAEQRRHRADAFGHRLLHGVAAHAQEPRRVADREAAGRRERGIFAERMAGDIGGMRS